MRSMRNLMAHYLRTGLADKLTAAAAGWLQANHCMPCAVVRHHLQDYNTPRVRIRANEDAGRPAASHITQMRSRVSVCLSESS